MFFVSAWTYAICVNFLPAYRDPADAIGDSDLGLGEKSVRDEEMGKDLGDVREDSLEKA